MSHGWWRIEQPHACFALVVRDGLVIETAPIAAWAMNKPWPVVRRYFENRRAKIERVSATTARCRSGT